MKNLIEQARQGDAEAIEKIVQLHRPKLTATAFYYLKSYEEAQDAVQETFFQAFKSLHQLHKPQYFSTWLTKILIRQCFALLKKQKRELETTIELQQLEQMQQQAASDYDDLYEALHGLKRQYQTVLVLHYFYAFKLQEIASMMHKPLNTIKIQLHRARRQLKERMEAMQQHTIQKQDVNTMLQQLKEMAKNYFEIPSNYELCIEDVQEDRTTFLWKEALSEEGYYVEFDQDGKLRSLSQPIPQTGAKKDIQELQLIAEDFLTKQYPKALNYLTLTKTKIKENYVYFMYSQLVNGLPLDRQYCTFDIAFNGQIIEFNYRGYTKNPPSIPSVIVPKETLQHNLRQAHWQVKLIFLHSDSFTVPQSGIYYVYDTPVLHQAFDAVTGVNLYPTDDSIEEKPIFEPLPTLTTQPAQLPFEQIVGISDDMEIIRQAQIDKDELGIVWRDKSYTPAADKSMQSFITERFEELVKAVIDPDTKRLKSFIWFKERTGDQSLTFDECKAIAITFMQAHFSEYVPYLKLQVEERDFNQVQRAFFGFALFIDDVEIQGEHFNMSVNRTTGLVDTLMSPSIDANMLQRFKHSELITGNALQNATLQIDATLKWDYDYDTEQEKLIYTFANDETKQPVKGINATTGELIYLNI